MRAGDVTEQLSPPERALVQFVRKAADVPHRVTTDDVEELTAQGWTSAHVVEALSMAMLAAFTNTLSLTMRLEDDLEKFGMTGYF